MRQFCDFFPLRSHLALFFLCNLKKKLKRLNVEITKSTYYPASAIFLCRNSGHMQFEKKRKVFNCFFGGGRNLPQISNLLFFFHLFPDILFRQITTFIKVFVAFVFGLQTLRLIDFTKIYQLKGLKPKNKGHTNFYECCDLT